MGDRLSFTMLGQKARRPISGWPRKCLVMTRKALGKGLEALLGGLPIEDSGRAERLIEIDVHRILPNRYQPRQTFDDTGLQELAASIKAQGILQPVSVRRGE